MASKLDRERDAILQAETELEARKKRLLAMEKEETGKDLHRLVKKLGIETAIAVLSAASTLKPKKAIELLDAATRGASNEKSSAKLATGPTPQPDAV